MGERVGAVAGGGGGLEDGSGGVFEEDGPAAEGRGASEVSVDGGAGGDGSAEGDVEEEDVLLEVGDRRVAFDDVG